MKKIIMKKIFFILLLIILFGVGGWIYLNSKNNDQINGFYKVILNKKSSARDNKINPTIVYQTNTFNLDIISPQNNTTVSTQTVVISGKTKPNAEVIIGDKELVADNQGNFSLNYQLNEGENDIIIVANDSLGNYVEKNLKVNLEFNQ